MTNGLAAITSLSRKIPSSAGSEPGVQAAPEAASFVLVVVAIEEERPVHTRVITVAARIARLGVIG
jgi:hypothetical protein